MHCKKCQTLFKNTCAVCPQCLSPVLSVDAKFIVKLLAASLCNPASILFALMAISPLDIIITRETNVFSLPLDFFPLYLLVALFFFLLIFAAVYAMSSSTCLPNFARTYVSVHLKYLFFYVWFPLMLIGGGMEGNVIGFILLPVYMLSQLISLPLFFWAMSRHLPTPPEGFIPMYRVTNGARLALASLGMLIVLGIFNSGQGYLWLSPITGDQSRIPAVNALQNAMESIKDRDPEKFERHVNLRGILYELRTQNKSDFDVEAVREKILAQIADGSAMPKGNEECDFLFELYGIAFGCEDLNDDTRFSNGSYLAHPLHELGAIRKNDLSLVTIPVLYTKYGLADQANFEVARHGGNYRIERILNLYRFSFYWHDESIKMQRLERLYQSGKRLPDLRVEPTEAVELKQYDEKQAKVKFVFQIKNESTLAFPHITVAALLRDRQSGQMIKQIYYSPILDNEKIALTANETRTFAVKSDQLKKYQVSNLLSGRYEIVLLVTEATTADNNKITLNEK